MDDKKDKERLSQVWNIYFRYYLNEDKSVSIEKLTRRYNHFSLSTYVECYQSFIGVLKNTFLGTLVKNPNPVFNLKLGAC